MARAQTAVAAREGTLRPGPDTARRRRRRVLCGWCRGFLKNLDGDPAFRRFAPLRLDLHSADFLQLLLFGGGQREKYLGLDHRHVALEFGDNRAGSAHIAEPITSAGRFSPLGPRGITNASSFQNGI